MKTLLLWRAASPPRTVARSNRADVKQDCRLLKLPAELRNRIYEDTLADIKKLGTLHIRNRAFSKVPALAQVCRQLRSEFLPLFTEHAPRKATKLVCHVHNFDFDDLLEILEQAAKNRRTSAVKGLGIRVRVTFDAQPTYQQHADSLVAWFKRCTALAKRLKFQRTNYSAVGQTPGLDGFVSFEKGVEEGLSSDQHVIWAAIRVRYCLSLR